MYNADMSANGANETSGVRSRTRRAILDAAIQLLSENPAAPLSEIAQAAEVGRTTLHRYFPSRADLLSALSSDILEKIEEAASNAHLDDGPAAEALLRLCQEYFDLGDVLSLMFTMPELTASEQWSTESESDRKLKQLIERGHEDGTIDPDIPYEWIGAELLWAALYTGWDYVRNGLGSRHDARRFILLTISRTIAPPPEHVPQF